MLQCGINNIYIQIAATIIKFKRNQINNYIEKMLI